MFQQQDLMLFISFKVESDLKRQVADLNERLSSAMVGRQSESEMYEEAVLKASRMENAVTELEARCDAMAMENVDLKEHLNNALEHQGCISICYQAVSQMLPKCLLNI